MQYALIKNGIVENIIIADEMFISNLTDYDYIVEISEQRVMIGSTYNGEVFTDPGNEQVVETRMTKLQFQLRFTFEELVAIEAAAETSAAIRVLQRQQQVAEYIDLADPNTQLGIMYLVSAGLLTQERGTEILTP